MSQRRRGIGTAGEGAAQYEESYAGVGKEFRLSARGRPDVPIRATRSCWATPEEGKQVRQSHG